MKKIVCELCGNTEFEKSNGFFVCCGCGTKYSTEEAKALVVEIDEGAEAAAKVPETAPAKEEAVEEEAPETVIEVEVTVEEKKEAPAEFVKADANTNLVGDFYRALNKVKESFADPDMTKRRQAFAELTAKVSAINNNYDIDDEAKYRDAFTKMSDDIMELYCSDYKFNEFVDEKGVKRNDSKDTGDLIVGVLLEMISMYNSCYDKFAADSRRSVLYIKKAALNLEDALSSSAFIDAKQRVVHLKICDQMVQEITALDPSFKPVDDYKKFIAREERAAANKSSGGGCCSGCATGMIAAMALVVFIICLIF